MNRNDEQEQLLIGLARITFITSLLYLPNGSVCQLCGKSMKSRITIVVFGFSGQYAICAECNRDLHDIRAKGEFYLDMREAKKEMKSAVKDMLDRLKRKEDYEDEE